eukprot:1193078-Prorocentrum_minimum.AAC.1
MRITLLDTFGHFVNRLICVARETSYGESFIVYCGSHFWTLLDTFGQSRVAFGHFISGAALCLTAQQGILVRGIVHGFPPLPAHDRGPRDEAARRLPHPGCVPFSSHFRHTFVTRLSHLASFRVVFHRYLRKTSWTRREIKRCGVCYLFYLY